MRQLKAEYYKMKYSRASKVGFSIYGIYFFLYRSLWEMIHCL
mgnify:CR=1 FL=1